MKKLIGFVTLTVLLFALNSYAFPPYAPGSSGAETDPIAGAVTGIIKADGGGNLSAAVADTDYQTTVSLSKSITIEDPTASEDITLWFTNVAITVTAIEGVIIGSTSADVNIVHHTDRSNAGNDVCASDETVSSTTTGDNFTLGGDITIPVNSFVWLETSALADTPDELNVTIRYTED